MLCHLPILIRHRRKRWRTANFAHSAPACQRGGGGHGGLRDQSRPDTFVAQSIAPLRRISPKKLPTRVTSSSSSSDTARGAYSQACHGSAHTPPGASRERQSSATAALGSSRRAARSSIVTYKPKREVRLTPLQASRPPTTPLLTHSAPPPLRISRRRPAPVPHAFHSRRFVSSGIRQLAHV